MPAKVRGMAILTYDELAAARESLPEGLKDIGTATTIQALRAYTERTGTDVDVGIPAHDLEMLLVSGFVKLIHLQELDDGRYQITIDCGEILVQKRG